MEGEIKIQVNLDVLILADLTAHVSRILRDKGAMNKDISDSIHSYDMRKWMDKFNTLTEENQKLREALGTQLQTLKAIISGKRIVNLDEAIAYYESLLHSTEQPPKEDGSLCGKFPRINQTDSTDYMEVS